MIRTEWTRLVSRMFRGRRSSTIRRGPAIQVTRLEDRVNPVAITYVDQAGDYTITTDNGAPGLDVGDIVTWNGIPSTPNLLFGTDAFTSIQDAVNATDPNGTVNVAAGNYTGGVDVYKTVTLTGTGNPTVTAAYLNGPFVGFRIAADNVIVQGFAFNGTGSESGIYLADKNVGPAFTNATIQNNTFTDLDSGILSADGAVDFTNALIQNNTFTPGSGTWGLYLQSGSGHTIYGNNFSGTASQAGMLIQNSNNVTVGGTGIGQGNTFTGLAGSVLVADATNTKFIGNTVTGTLNNRGAVRVEGNVNGFTITHNTITGGVNPAVRVRQNFSLLPNGGLVINNNTFTGNTHGIQVDATGLANPVDARFNYITGNSTANVTNDDTSFGVDVSGSYLGSSLLPAVSSTITGAGTVDYSPYLNSGTDTNIAVGFQGEFSSITVHTAGTQNGATGRVQEGANIAAEGGTVTLLTGTYTEPAVAVAKNNLTLQGSPVNSVTITNALNATGTGTLTVNDVAFGGGTFTNYATVNLGSTSAIGGTYAVTGTTVSRTVDQPTGTVTLTTVTNLTLNGGSGNDTYNVTPAAAGGVNITVDGNTQGAADTLVYNGTGLTPTVTHNNATDGKVTAPTTAQLNFLDIESVSLTGTSTVAGTPGNDNVTVRLQGAGPNLEYQVGAGPWITIVAPANFTFNADAGDDTLTVDFSNGSLGVPVFYNGQGQSGVPGDKLVLTGGSTTTVAHTFVNANDGSITLTGAIAGTITYTGLEPVIDNMGAVNRTFTFTDAGNETVTLSDTGGADGKSTIDSTAGESVEFVNPTGSLTVTATTGTDDVTINGIDAAFGASVSVSATGNITVQAAGLNNTAGTGGVSLTSAGGVGTITVQGNGIDSKGAVTLSAPGLVTVTNGGIDNSTGTGDVSITSTAAGVAVDQNGVATAGNATVSAAGNTSVINGGINTLAGTGSISVTTSAGTATVDNLDTAGTVTVNAPGLVTVNNGGIDADAGTGTVSITSTGAGVSIADGGVLAKNTVTVTAQAGVAVAGNGIDNFLGGAGAGTVSVNTATGNISITDGGIQSTSTVGLTATAGAITTPNGGTDVRGTVLTAAAATGIDLDTNVTSVTATTSGNGAITIDEADAITLTNVTSANGAITVTAGGAIVATNVVSATDADANDISITAATGDITVGTVNAGTAAGDVTLTATTGGIFDDANDATTDVTGDVVTLTAATGIGTGVNGSLDTAAASLDASVTAAGNIAIDEADLVTLTAVDTANGSITIIAGGAVTVTSVVSTTDADANDISITAAAGDITLGTVNAGTTAGDVILSTVVGSILDGGTSAVTGDVVTLTANGEIGQPGAADINTTANSWFLMASNSAGPSKGIWVTDADAVTVTSATTTDGVVILASGGKMTATLVTAGGSGKNVRLETTSGDIDVGFVAAPLDIVRLIAAGAITDGNAAANNIAASKLSASAANGIDLDTTLDVLAASNTTAGAITVRNTGNLLIDEVTFFGTVTGVTNTGGAVNINTGKATSDAVLTVSKNVSGAGAVALTSDQDVLVNATFTVQSTGSTVTINADTVADADATGATVTINGSLNGATGVAINTGDDADNVSVTATGSVAAGTGGLAVTTNAGGDTVSVTGGVTAGAASAITTGAGDDTILLNTVPTFLSNLTVSAGVAGSDNDTLLVNDSTDATGDGAGSLTHDTLTGVFGNDTHVLTFLGVEVLDLRLSNQADTIAVNTANAASELTTVTVVANDGADTIAVDAGTQAAVGGAAARHTLEIVGGNGNDAVTVGGPIADAAGLSKFTFNAGADDDSLTLNYGTALSIQNLAVVYNGDAPVFNPGTMPPVPPGDTLTINAAIGTTFNTIIHTFGTGAAPSSISLDGKAPNITYTSVERIQDNLVAANRVFRSAIAAPETITVSDDTGAVAGRSQVVDSAALVVEFANPTNSLTVETETVGGAGADVVNVLGLDPAFDAHVTITAGEDDVVEFKTNPTVIDASGTTPGVANPTDKNLVVTGGTVKVNQAVTATGNVTISGGAGNGLYTVGVNAAGSLTSQNGTVTINAGLGNDTVTVAAAGTVTAQKGVTILGDPQGSIAGGNDTVTIAGPVTATTGNVLIGTDSGATDAITISAAVQATAGDVIVDAGHLNGYDGQDTVQITGAGGKLAAPAGDVYIRMGGGVGDVLTIDSTAAPAAVDAGKAVWIDLGGGADTFNLAAGAKIKAAGSNGIQILADYFSIEDGADVINLAGTLLIPGAGFAMQTGAGGDTVTVSGLIDAKTGVVFNLMSVGNGTDTDTFTVAGTGVVRVAEAGFQVVSGGGKSKVEFAAGSLVDAKYGVTIQTDGFSIDDADDTVILAGTITGTVNGTIPAAKAENSLQVWTGGGADAVTIAGPTTVPNGFTLNTGANVTNDGADVVTVSAAVSAANTGAMVVTGAGVDTFTNTGSITVQDDIRIDSGPEGDAVTPGTLTTSKGQIYIN